MENEEKKEVVKEENVETTEIQKEEGVKRFGVKLFLEIFGLIIVLAWIALFFYDYSRARHDKLPTFCIKEVTHSYDDGSVEECVSLGYKAYKYNRKSVRAVFEFGSIFLKERTK